MDPLSMVAMAGTAFKVVEGMVSRGAEIEQVAQKLGHWFTIVSDIKQAEAESENPPLFKKVFDGASVEEQALNSVIAKKKVEEQERQIRELITWAYGTETYKEMMQMRKDIRAKRERIIYRRRKKRQRMLDISFLTSALIFCGGIIWGMVSIIGGAR
jgi:serine/threonine protein phosphatase PrpC